MKLKKILFLFITSISIYKITVSNPKYSLTRIISFTTGVFSQITIPKNIRKPLFWLMIKKYGMIEKDMLEPLENYKTVQQFFTRAVKPRNLSHYTRSTLLSPADSKILSISQITSDKTLLIKNVTYSLCEFYTGKKNCIFTPSEITALKKHPKNSLHSIIFYLSPGDYHRFHSPLDYHVKKSRYIPGSLLGVDELSLAYLTKVYENNERVVLEGYGPLGTCFVGIVGALNVGSILLDFDQGFRSNEFGLDFKIRESVYDLGLDAGQQMGMFRLGSTVVLLVETPPGFEFFVKEGDHVRYGDLVGK